MLLGKRIARLEQAQKARLERMMEGMSQDELLAALDTSYGPGAGVFFDGYLDALPLAQLEALVAGDIGEAAKTFQAFDAWQADHASLAPDTSVRPPL